jgi:hypothetical protein
MRIAVGLLLGVMIAFAIACGAAAKSKSAAPTVAPGADPMGAMSPQQEEIQRLNREIVEAASKLKITRVVPMNDMNPASANVVAPSGDPTCKPAASDSCKDVCTLAESICKNAKRICEIATEMGNDEWANDKCEQGVSSCDAARKRCCDCT